MALSFTAIDFETANEQRASACAVGITTVRNGRITETLSWFISPPGGIRFTNTWIHGISASHVAGAASWVETATRINELAGDTPLVAYNSPFDKGVHSAACVTSDMEHAGHVWRDARVLAKTHLDLPGYRLVHVAKHLGIDDFEHHDAAADAHACAQVTLAIARLANADDVETLWPVTARPQRTIARRLPLPDPNVQADPAHPLYGASLAFTGELVSLSRNEARAAVASLGAIVTAGPTRKSDLVVVGGFDPATLRPGTTVSSKLQKVLDLKQTGQQIEIISEADLLALLAYEPSR